MMSQPAGPPLDESVDDLLTGSFTGTFPAVSTSESSAAVPSESDQELIDRCVLGEPETFGVLVRRYERRLFHALAQMLGSAEDAQDIAQEAFVHAYRKLGTFRGESSFYSWLFRIAMNAGISSRRRGRHETTSVERLKEQAGEEPLDLRESSSPTYSMDLADRQRLVRTALAQTTAEFRDCIVLKEIDGLSYEEIAEVLSVPIGTVRSRIHRGRVELRERLRVLLEPEL